MLRYIDQEAMNPLHSAAVPAQSRGVVENVSRRGFIKSAGVGGSLVLAMQLLPSRTAQAFEPYPTGAAEMANGTVTNPHVFVAITADGTVTLTTHRSEMGTGARTGVPMVLADELEADWQRVVLKQAEGDEPKYGNQDTDGSRSLRHFVQPMRQIGASVRQMLEAAAAERWGVSPQQVRARMHRVHLLDGRGASARETGRSLGYGELAGDAMALPVPAFEQLVFKTDEQFRYMGTGEIPMADLHDITTGKAIYGADVRLNGMKYAVVARPPVVGGKVKSFDAGAALKVPGVVKVVEIAGSMPPAKFAPLGGIAVVANNTWAAIQARDKLIIEWEDGPHGNYDTKAFHAEMAETAKQPGKVLRKQGDADAAFKTAVKVVSAQYYQPHMSHAQMEPLVAVADYRKDGSLEIWGPVQSPYGARVDTAAALGIDPGKVRVNVTLLGGGFGRKSKCDYVIEAALVSKAVGAPVKLQWTREDDMHHGFYHTTSVEQLEAGFDAGGKLTAWRHRSVSPTIFSSFVPDPGYTSALEGGMGLVDTPVHVPNVSIETGKAMAHTRIGWFRAVSNIPRAFAVQSFIGELAHEMGRDPKDMLLEVIGPARKIDPAAADMKELWNYGEPYEEFPNDTGRLRHVVELAAEKANWGRQLPRGEGMGIAVHRSFVTYVATVVRVRIAEDGTIHVPEVHTAVDCGFCINPERVQSQMEGAAVMGMTLALDSAITFEKGRVVQSNYHDYPVVRITAYPERVHTHIVPHPFSVHATGVGEPGLPPFAPALANAIFAASGKRLRDMPFGQKLI